jgi:hypothetical protein
MERWTRHYEGLPAAGPALSVPTGNHFRPVGHGLLTVHDDHVRLRFVDIATACAGRAGDLTWSQLICERL